MTQSAKPEEIVEQATQFADEHIRPHAAKFDREGGISTELIKAMGERRYLGAVFPERYGGLGLDQLHYGYLTEAIGMACASTRALLTVHTSLVGEALLKWGTKEQKDRYLPAMAQGDLIACFALTEPDIGTDAKSVSTRYEKSGSGFVLSGKKKWITMSGIADLFLVIARDDGGQISAFLVPRSAGDITTTPIEGLLAGRSAYISEVEFNNVEIGADSLLGRVGMGFTYVVNTALDCGRHSIAWAGQAIATEALEAMVTYARQRRQFGAQICTFQLIQGMIADAATKVHAGRALCVAAAKMRDEKHDDAVIQTTMAKYFTSKIAAEISTDCVQVHGGNGCCDAYPAERLFREAKVLEIIEGTSQIQQEIISKHALARRFRGSHG